MLCYYILSVENYRAELTTEKVIAGPVYIYLHTHKYLQQNKLHHQIRNDKEIQLGR